MFCSNCGNPLTEGAAFCQNCGTPITPPEKPKKKKKKGLLIGIIAGVTAFAVAAGCVGGWFLFGNKETVYVMTEMRAYDKNGVNYSIVTYEYDDQGRILNWEQDLGERSEVWDDEQGIFIYNWDQPDGEIDSYHRYEYDDHGNLTRTEESTVGSELPYIDEYEWEYDGDQIVSMSTVHIRGELSSSPANYEFEYEDGNLVAMTKVASENSMACPAVLASYDEKGRLIREAAVQMETTYIYEYEYDKKGNLTEVTYSCGPQAGLVAIGEDPFENAKVQNITEFSYDGNKLVEVRRENAEGEQMYHMEYKYDGKKLIAKEGDEDCEFAYDGKKLVSGERGDEEYTFDKNGNLIKIEYADGSAVKYEYEKLRLSKADAEDYYRQQMQQNLLSSGGAWQSNSFARELLPFPICPELRTDPLCPETY